MVSNSLHMALEDLVAALTRIRNELGEDPEYREARATLPEDWPM